MLRENKPLSCPKGRGGNLIRLVAVGAVALLASACQPNSRPPKVGAMLVADPTQNHPIRVAQRPVTLDLVVQRGDYGLSPQRMADLEAFLEAYRQRGTGKLKILAPSGTPNESAAFRVLGDVRRALKNAKISRQAIDFAPYSPEGDPEAPIRLSFARYVAEGPECGDWSEDLTRDEKNLPYANFGCATQHNLAAMIANPRDLITPRDMAPRAAERRDVTWRKYVKGQVTTAKKSKDQTAKMSKTGGN